MSHNVSIEQSNEGPSQSGGIIRSVSPATMAEQFSEGPGPRTWGIVGSAVPKRGVKRKLNAKSLETKYKVLMEVEIKETDRRQLQVRFQHSVDMGEEDRRDQECISQWGLLCKTKTTSPCWLSRS